MSGTDEQPVYPSCPMCKDYGTIPSFWVVGFTNVEIRNGRFVNDSLDLKEYIYFDKLVNDNRCSKTDEQIITRVMVSQGVATYAYDKHPVEKALAMLLSDANAIICSNDHVVVLDTDLFKKICDCIMRFAYVEGVKWE